MCKIPRTSSTLCQHLINPKWQILLLSLGADHVCTTEVLGTELELNNKKLLIEGPAQAADSQDLFQPPGHG